MSITYAHVNNGLLLQGVPIFQQGMFLTGANVDGEIEIRQFNRALDLEATYEAEEFRPSLESVQRAIRLAGRLRAMQDTKDGRWGRLLRALRVLLNANRTGNSHGERFHQFVRALDGIAKTRPQKGTTDFAHRVQTFTVASQDTWATLVEMYDVRGAVEHLKSPTDAVAVTLDDEDSRRQRVNRLTRQADALVRFTLCHILERDDLFEIFDTDENIDRFWAL